MENLRQKDEMKFRNQRMSYRMAVENEIQRTREYVKSLRYKDAGEEDQDIKTKHPMES